MRTLKKIVGRLRIANHGTSEDPKYVVLGILHLDALKSINGLAGVIGKESALIDIVTCFGELSLDYAGLPVDSGYGRTFDDVWAGKPCTFATEMELEKEQNA